MEEVKYDEQQLARKAQRIVKYQKELDQFEAEKAKLEGSKPTTNKDQLSYDESIRFGQKMDHYNEKLQNLKNQIQKVKRQLSALEYQAQKLIPVAGVNIRVSLHSESDNSSVSYCIKQVKTKKEKDEPPNIHIHQL